MDEFDAIAAELLAQERAEGDELARDILRAADHTTGFVELLRRIPRGDVVTVATTDGGAVQGRLQRVGLDWVRLAEISDAAGTSRAHARRIHVIRIATVVRISREVAP
jgi:hypothetical protein